MIKYVWIATFTNKDGQERVFGAFTSLGDAIAHFEESWYIPGSKWQSLDGAPLNETYDVIVEGETIVGTDLTLSKTEVEWSNKAGAVRKVLGLGFN